MDIEVNQLADDLSCIRVNGRLDSAGVDRAETRFSAAVVAPGRNALVDLSGVDFMASMGIRMLITCARALQQRGAKMVLFGATEMVQSVLDTVALDQIIPVVATQDEARAALAA